MAQWAHLGRARAPFHLYVPAGSVDIAKRLATENGVNVSEIWSFHTIGDQTRFTLVHRAPVPQPRRAAPAAERPDRPKRPAAPRRVAKPVARKTAARSARSKPVLRKAAPERVQKRK
jgi:hypothetical protein